MLKTGALAVAVGVGWLAAEDVTSMRGSSPVARAENGVAGLDFADLPVLPPSSALLGGPAGSVSVFLNDVGDSFSAASTRQLFPTANDIPASGLGLVGRSRVVTLARDRGAEVCDDGDPCTIDTCDCGECVHMPATGDCCIANGTPSCADPNCCSLVCEIDPFCCDTSWDGNCAGEANDLCAVCQTCGPGSGDCCQSGGNGTPGCNDADCCAVVCGIDPFCCDTSWDGICANEALEFCELCAGPPGCIVACPPGASMENEPCGTESNGGCNSTPPAFTCVRGNSTWCGDAWAAGGTRDTDWYFVNHNGGVISATLVSEFPGVCFIVDGVGPNGVPCAPVLVGEIGCSNNCVTHQPASADLPAGTYGLVVAPGTCDGSGIFEGVPCGSNNHYVLNITYNPGEDPCPSVPDEFPAAGPANRLATGDLNGDLQTDVIIAIPGVGASDPGSIQVFLNLGVDASSNWQGLLNVEPQAVGLMPSAVALGTLNADAHLDAAVTSERSLMVFFNAGDGTFDPPVVIPTGHRLTAVAAADLTGDGFVDLVVTNDQNQISIFANDGSGAFSAAGDLDSGGGSPVAIDPSDVDGDRSPDLVGLNELSFESSNAPGSVFVILNDPAGGFGDVETHQIGVGPTDVSVGDLDLDGLPDIVAANGSSSTLSILINQGNGVFGDAIVLPVQDPPLSVEVAELIGDCGLDMVVMSAGTLQVFENLGQCPGDLSFSASDAIELDGAANFLATAEFNDDLAVDVAIVNGELAVVCSGDVDGDGVVGITDFLAVLGSWGPCPDPPDPCPADLDGDGTVGMSDFMIVLDDWGDCPS